MNDVSSERILNQVYNAVCSKLPNIQADDLLDAIDSGVYKAFCTMFAKESETESTIHFTIKKAVENATYTAETARVKEFTLSAPGPLAFIDEAYDFLHEKMHEFDHGPHETRTKYKKARILMGLLKDIVKNNPKLTLPEEWKGDWIID